MSGEGPLAGPPPPPFGDFGGPPGEHPGLHVRNAAAPPAAAALRGLEPSRALGEALARQLRAAPGTLLTFQAPADARRLGASSDADPLVAGSAVAALRDASGQWRVAVRTEPPAGAPWWLWAALAEALLLLPLALLFAYTLAAPTRRLAAAARAAGQAAGAAPLAVEGPAELRAATSAFNALQERLGRLVQERTHMVAAIAHDLRTPLTRLAFRVDDLPAPLGDKVRADVAEMTAMIAAALDFIRERAVQGQFERLDMRSLVERVVEEQSDLGHDVTLEPGPPLTVSGVPLALRRMLVNLVENARKYGERARLRLAVSDGRCELQVDDDGPGIPEALQAQVFDPFYRIEGSRNRRTGGAGLGLATVRAVVREHDGEIRLANRAGGGLRVSVLLPLTAR